MSGENELVQGSYPRHTIDGMPSNLRTVLFVDMLGFAEMTLSNPDWTETREDGDRISSGTTETANQFHHFHWTIEWALKEQRFRGGAQAMAFSDCAFIAFETSLTACTLAIALMQRCISHFVPVRMGMARGTFNVSRVGTDRSGPFEVNRSLFFGSAVVLSHCAESKAGKGMRVFVHESVYADANGQSSSVRFLPLPEATGHATHELDILQDSGFSSTSGSLADQSQLFFAVKKMTPGADHKAAIHYSETIAALNRMRGVPSGAHVFGT